MTPWLKPWPAALALLSLSGCGDLFGPDPRVAASVAMIDGNAQTGVVGEPLDEPFRVEVRDQDGDPLPGAVVEWSAPSGSIAPETVTDSRGVASAVLTLGEAAGPHTARAAVAGLDQVDFAALALPGAPAEIHISPDSTLMEAIGDTVTLQAETRDRFGNAVADAVVEWSSSDATVVEVDALGRVMSHGTGRAVVTAAAGDAADAAAVVVDQRIAAVALGPAPDTLRSFGETAVLDVTATDANGFEVRGAEITWSSLDAGVATVDAMGAVTARGRGSASVVAAAAGVADTLVLAVIPWGRVTVSMELNRWEIYDVVYPIMERHGLTGNLEVAIQYIGDADRITVPQIREMHDAGWAVVPHSITLRSLPELSDAEMRREVLGSQAWVRDRGFRGSWIFIVPGHNAGERELALIRRHFVAARTRGYLHVRTMTDWPTDRPYGIVGLEGEGFLDTQALRSEMREIWRSAIHEGRLLEIYFHRVKASQAAGFEAFIRELAEYSGMVRTFAELFEE